MRVVGFFLLCLFITLHVEASQDPVSICRKAAGFDDRGFSIKEAEPTFIEICRGVVQKYPDQPDLLAYLGITYHRLNRSNEGVQLLRQAAERGSVIGWTGLGALLLNGMAVDKDEAQGLIWLNKAAVQGDAEAQYYLGQSYRLGLGVQPNHVQAAKWYRKAAEQGSPRSQHLLGEMYLYGLGVEWDDVQGADWIRKAAEQGDQRAQMGMSQLYRKGLGVKKDVAQALIWLRKVAEQENPEAQIELGNHYYSGNAVEKDQAQAAIWYRKAAENNNPLAQFNLGAMYLYGNGVEKNTVQAFNWIRKAAEQGHMDAQAVLGDLYYEGRVIEKDLAQSITWYRKAAEQNSMSAQISLGLMYLGGEGVEKDEKQALVWFKNAAKKGSAQAKRIIGTLIEQGRGAEKNRAEALKWYLASAEGGNEYGQTVVVNQLTKEVDSETQAMLQKRAIIGSVSETKLLISWLLSANQPQHIGDALRRLELLANSAGRIQPWLDGVFRQRLDAALLASALGQLKEPKQGLTAARIAAIVKNGWPALPERPERWRNAFDRLYALLGQSPTEGVQHDAMADWLKETFKLSDGFESELEFLSSLFDPEILIYRLGEKGPSDWILAWGQAASQPLDADVHMIVGAALLSGSRNDAVGFLEPLSHAGSMRALALQAIAHARGLKVANEPDRSGEWARKAIESGQLDQGDRLTLGRLYVAALRRKFEAGESQSLQDARWLLGQMGGDLNVFRDAPTCRGPWDAICIEKSSGRLYLHPSSIVRPVPGVRSADCAATPKRLRALLVGVNRYELPELGGSSSTANDLPYLQAAMRSLPFFEHDVQTLSNREVNYSSLTGALNTMLASAQCEDALWLHFDGSGHAQAGLQLPGWRPSPGLNINQDSTYSGGFLTRHGADNAAKPAATGAGQETLVLAPDNQEALSPRDLAALILAGRRSGARIVLSLDVPDATRIDLWRWMGGRASFASNDVVDGAEDWWMSPQSMLKSPENDWVAPLLGEHPGQFLFVAPQSSIEADLNRCEGNASASSEKQTQDAKTAKECKQRHGLFSFMLANALMTDTWATPAELSRTIQELPSAVRVNDREMATFRFVTSDRSFPLLNRGNKNPAKAESLRIEVISPDPVLGSRGASRITLRPRENIFTLQARVAEAPLPKFLVINGQSVLLRSNGTFTLDVPVQASESSMVVWAIFEDGTSRNARIDIRYEGRIEDLLGQERYYALLIGNQDYEYDRVWKDLATPIQDVEAIAEQLRSNYGFQTSVINSGREESLVLKNAKQADIFKTLKKLKLALTNRDRLLIYYAGHGYRKDQRAYWIPVDGSGDPLDSYTWVDARQFANELKQLQAKSVLVVADSCFSGGFARFGDPDAVAAKDRAGDERTMQAFLAEMMRRPSRKLLSSGADEPVWDGGGKGHSVFARAFLDGLGKAESGAFSAGDLYHRYIMHQVTGNSEQAPQYEAIQDSGHEGGDFVFMRRPAVKTKD